jgi:aerobic carbon-monoxide dehydrogenase small subunit
MSKTHITTSINHEPVEFLADPGSSLLDVLRNTLGLTGTKEGCGTGDCGACSITVDDRLVCSCLMLAVEAQGHELHTIEGMAHGDKLHPLQQKFLEMAALQCGICTSGMLVASDALLRKNSKPSEEEVRFWLAGNLCRCTGYDKIVRAVMETAAEMREAAQ